VRLKVFGPSAFKCTLLACLLVAAEAFAIVHPLELDAHSTDTQCKICVSVAAFGSAAVASPLAFVVVRATPELPVDEIVVSAHSRPTRQFARGPPTAS
jgi:hypothetical protein